MKQHQRTVHPSGSPRHTILRNNHGAVFLLAVYVSALAVLLFSGITIQRTNTELRAALVSRDVQQAFWNGEAALEAALIESRTNHSLRNMTEYPVVGMSGKSTFRVVPVQAEIFNDNIDARSRVRRHWFDPYQKIVKKIVGTGFSPGWRKQTVSAYVMETGPLRGLWANGTIAVAGGRGIDPRELFLSGDLYSSLGSVVSKIDGGSQTNVGLSGGTLKFDGLINVPKDVLAGSWEEKLTHWESVASREILSLKNGYKIINGMVGEPLTQSNGSYSPVQFVSGSESGKSEHVDGAVSVGMMETAGVFDTRQCNHVAQLMSQTVVINNNFNCDRYGSNTPGLGCIGNVEDHGREPSEITMCVAALVPGSSEVWLNTLMDNPPHLIFRQPTTLLVTGSAPFDISGMRADVLGQSIQTGMFGDPKDPTNPFRTTFAVQTDWQVTIGAKISGEDIHGNPVPVTILQTDAKARKRDRTPHGLIFLKPGNKFVGSIYAPESLVVVRARECGLSCPPLEMQYVVGNEVVIELENEKFQLGQTVSASKDDEEYTTDFLTWVNR